MVLAIQPSGFTVVVPLLDLGPPGRTHLTEGQGVAGSNLVVPTKLSGSYAVSYEKGRLCTEIRNHAPTPNTPRRLDVRVFVYHDVFAKERTAL